MKSRILFLTVLILSLVFIFLGNSQRIHISEFTIITLFGVSTFAAALLLKAIMKE